VQFELVGDVLALGRNSGDLPGMVESGELAACYMSTVRFAADVPELKILELPFVVRDRPTAIRALQGPLGDSLQPPHGRAHAFSCAGLLGQRLSPP
jgi:TRAP-type C4-dicarboxylate transport system substrate-binding protein